MLFFVHDCILISQLNIALMQTNYSIIRTFFSDPVLLCPSLCIIFHKLSYLNHHHHFNDCTMIKCIWWINKLNFAPVQTHFAPVWSHFAPVLSRFAPLYHLVMLFCISRFAPAVYHIGLCSIPFCLRCVP